MALSFAQLEGIWIQAGGSSGTAPIAAAIALAESGGRPDAHNPVPPDDSYGLWQINMLGSMGPARRRQYGISSNDKLYDPLTNAKAAVAISGAGKSFGAWSTFTNGAYRSHLQGGVAPAIGSNWDFITGGGGASATLGPGSGASGGSGGGVIPAGLLGDFWNFISQPGTILNPFNLFGQAASALSSSSGGGLLDPITGPFEAIGTAALMASKIMNTIVTHMFLPATYIRIACFSFGSILVISGIYVFFTGRVPNPINAQTISTAAKVIK